MKILYYLLFIITLFITSDLEMLTHLKKLRKEMHKNKKVSIIYVSVSVPHHLVLLYI